MKVRKLLAVALTAATLSVGVAAVTTACGGKEKPPVVTPTEGPETGVYYFDVQGDEYLIALNNADKFAFTVNGENKSGTYTLEGETLKLAFYGEGGETLTATYAEGAITLTYGGSTMRFLKKVKYTVSFDTAGGSAVAAVSVVNGRTVSKPADPERAGFIFLGWYTDDSYSEAFSFGSVPITQDTTVYARWAESSQTVVGQAEYEISFDLGYAGGANPERVKTVGGKLLSLPADPVREGYTFVGWWISMNESEEKPVLSYRYSEDLVFGENTTLFAVWRNAASSAKLAEPAVSVFADRIEWNAVAGALSYELTIEDEDGQELLNESLGEYSKRFDFSAYPAGDYTVKVTAMVGASSANNSDTAVRLYRNKALGRVSLFEVAEDSTLIFNSVANAENYYVTLECGSEGHVHELVYNGSSTTFGFANCTVGEEGFKFTVRATANGFADSVSHTFTYNRLLGKIGEIAFDESSETFAWGAVANASEYIVTVTCKNAEHDHKTIVSNGNKTSFSVKEFAPCAGGLEISVLPVTKGYNSPEATKAAYEKKTLATPAELRLTGKTLSWTGAADGRYEVRIGGIVLTAETNSIELNDARLAWETGDFDTVQVRAVGAVSSLWSDPVTVRFNEMFDALSYDKGVLRWGHVLTADSYDVFLNGALYATVTDGKNYGSVTLNRAGINTLEVCYHSGDYTSPRIAVEVLAHTITFDTRGGSAVAEAYKAVGDPIELPTAEKTGYDFAAWYNVPGGLDANGAKYTDRAFGENTDLTLYAYYTPKTYLAYCVSGNGQDSQTEVKFGKSFTLPVPVSSAETRAFGGWFSAANGTGTQLTDANGNSVIGWPFAADTTLYAFWEDLILDYEEATIEGVAGYRVSAGRRVGVEKITVPETYRGKPVIAIADNAFFNQGDCDTIREIEIPDTLLLVSSVDPFKGCINLERITVRRVEGNDRIRYASDDGVLLDYGRLDDQSALATLAYVPASKTGRYAVSNKVGVIPASAFASRKISTIEIPATVNYIGAEAFADCAELTSVIFANPSALTNPLTIGARAFLNCTKLTEFQVPARATSLPLTRFTYTSADGNEESKVEGTLTSTAGSNNITDLFYGCSALAKIEVNSANTAYASEDGVLLSKDKKQLLAYPKGKNGAYTIPAGVTTIASGAFFGCGSVEYETKYYHTVGFDEKGDPIYEEGRDPVSGGYDKMERTEVGRKGLTAITIPAWVTEVGECAFYGCPALTSVGFEGPVGSGTVLGKNAFRGSEKLATLNFATGSNVKTIGEGAFAECNALNAVRVPGTVTRVEKDAFRGCAELAELRFEDSAAADAVMTIADHAISDCPKLGYVYLPKQLENPFLIYSGSTPTVEISTENPNAATDEFGVLYNPEKTKVMRCMNSELTEYEIPAGVTEIASDAFKGISALKKITFGGDLVLIDQNAFSGCSGLETVIFKAGTADLTIGNGAFAGCTALSALEVPARTVKIEARAFAQTGKLATLAFEENGKIETIGNGAFSGSGFTAVTIPKSVKAIGNDAFYSSRLETLNFEANGVLEKIGTNAFACDSGVSDEEEEAKANAHLVAVNGIPKTVTDIGSFAFANQRNLRTFTFEAGGESDLAIGVTPLVVDYYVSPEEEDVITLGQVFANCVSLEALKLPARTKQLSYKLFKGCNNLATVAFTAEGDTEESRLAGLFRYAFAESGITEITIPKSVANVLSGNGETSTNPMDFYNSDWGIYLIEQVESEAIGESAFADCKNLRTVSFEEGEVSVFLSDDMFSGCSALETVRLSKGVTDIESDGTVIASAFGKNVFAGCGSFKTFTVSAENPQYSAYEGVLYSKDYSKLVLCPIGKEETLTIHADCESAEAGAFGLCEKITELRIPGGFAFEMAMLNYFPSIANIVFEGEGGDFVFADGALYNGDKTELLFVPLGRTDDFNVAEGVLKIADGVFKNSLIKNVKLPSTLQEIGAEAFMGSEIVTLTVPASLKALGVSAFMNCGKLQTLTFADGCALAAIPESAFAGCGRLTQLRIPAAVESLASGFLSESGVTNVYFESNSKLKVIGESAFAEEGGSFTEHTLMNVEIPNGVTEIGERAFENCANLTSILIPASVTKIGAYAFSWCEGLANVTIAENSSLQTIGKRAFGNSGITSIVIPASVQTIEGGGSSYLNSDGAFHACTKLQTLEFEAEGRLTAIGAFAFYDCKSLAIAELGIPAGVAEIGAYAFSGTKIQAVTVPTLVTEIANGLFSGCTALTSVTLHDNVKTIGNGAFENCTSLAAFTITKSVNSIAQNAFAGTNIAFTVDPANTTYKEDGNGGYTTLA